MIDRSLVAERRQPVSEIVAVNIRDRIISGLIEPGERLTEERLSQELDVSRGPVRDALRRLADEGVVVLVPNRGATVCGVTRRALTETFELREIFEGFAARRAAESLSDPETIRWFRAQAEIWSDTKIATDRTLFFEHNVRFHNGLAARCGNSRMAALMPRLTTPIPLHLQKFLDQHDDERRHASALDHGQTIEAILARDSIAAETLARYHVRRTAIQLQSLPDSAFVD